LRTADKKYIFKLHRSFDTKIAVQSANIMDYLSKQSFSVAPIVYTKSGHSTVAMFFPEGSRTGTLFDYVDGTMGYNLDFKSNAAKIGETMGLLHLLMEKYDKPVVRYGKEHYVDRYVNLMKECNYSPSKTDELDELGNELWSIVIKTKPGFCHGDFNVSNFIKAPNNKFVLFDFDCAGIAYPVNDIFTICSATESFADFKKVEYDAPTEKL
jgi:Ser/Thr protein kinase RdoA (MazF antagonist)